MEKRVRLVTATNIKQPQQKETPQQASVKVAVRLKKNPLEDLEMFLRFIKNNHGTKLTDVYKALKFSGRKGNDIKNKAIDNQLIKEKIYHTERKGRPLIELELTERGREYINEK